MLSQLCWAIFVFPSVKGNISLVLFESVLISITRALWFQAASGASDMAKRTVPIPKLPPNYCSFCPVKTFQESCPAHRPHRWISGGTRLSHFDSWLGSADVQPAAARRQEKGAWEKRRSVTTIVSEKWRGWGWVYLYGSWASGQPAWQSLLQLLGSLGHSALRPTAKAALNN